jgi:tetratricopeptide (TPR) repeat protein/transcriptional regulator with XRE-family HTH domain
MDGSDSTCPNEQLRQERIRHNWRQQDVADHVGTTVVTVNRWERGGQQPSAYFRVKLCALFGKSAEELGLVEVNALSSTPTEIEVSGEISTSSSSTDRLTLWTVPYLRNPYFTGRDDLLDLLNMHLSTTRQGDSTTTHRVALTQPQAIKGLGGIGKTQIAVEYAYRAREQGQYTHTFWIDAASKEAMMTSFTTLAELLPEFPAKNETNQQKLVKAVKRWLEQCQERWFLIFDNADDLSLIQEYFPHQGNGSILLTTRANAVGSLAASIEVEKMGLVEGTHLLLRRAQRFAQASDEEVNEAGNIVVALDHFPLALEQAGAYIEETGCSFDTYLQLYQKHRKALLARRGAQNTNYPDSVATTWSLSFQKVEQANPAAAELLRLCAFLAPDHIPEELLKDGVQYWPPLLQQATADLLAFNQMLEELLKFSLVKRLVGDHMLSLHRLVQVVQIDTMNPEEQIQWAERVICAVNTIFPPDPSTRIDTWPLCLRYLEQAQVCDTLIQHYLCVLPDAADLLDRTGTYLCEHASYTSAEPLFLRALRIREEQLGTEHPDVAHTLNGLADLYRQQGKYEQAEPLYQRALHIREETSEHDHPNIARTLNGLADLYRQQGKYEQAEPLYLRAWRIREQALGLEHPDTARTLSGLATIYFEQGKYEQAESLYQQALRIREQTLGPEHPDLARTLNNLAGVYFKLGEYERAEPLCQRALHLWEQALGQEHPLVSYALGNLSELYQQQGKYKQAEPLCQRSLRIREQTLGQEHLAVASSLNDLASIYQKQGMYTLAEPLFQRALHIWEQQIGLEHPDMAHTVNGLAMLYYEQKKYAEAEPLFQQALSIREQALEPDHPDIAETLHGFAGLQEAQDNSEKAVSLYCRALAIRVKVYGQQHPKTIDTRERLHAVSVALSRTEGRATLTTIQPEEGENVEIP